MASTPGILTDWPWKPLGSFKYLVLAPMMIHSIYLLKVEEKIDTLNLLIVPILLWRMIHNQLWISVSRYRTAKGNNRIVDKPIEFDQVDRESSWDDQIIFNGILFYTFNLTLAGASYAPLWRTDGVILIILLHMGPVEFLYYWFHRALHHHYLYSRYHSHHHSSVVTEPITSVIHPFAEHVVYYTLFAIPQLTIVVTGTNSIIAIAGYITYIDFMNNLGHCNFELIPKRLFTIFPSLKYLMYTPSFHSLHHTQFRTNYSLFMPFYDYLYGTMDKSLDEVYETSLQKPEDSPDVVHLTHLTTPESIYHLRLGFSSLASQPQAPKWYFWVMLPVTCWSILLTLIYGHTFVTERNTYKRLNLHMSMIPRFNTHYLLKWKRDGINTLIEDAILDADARGVKVLSLGLLNQGGELNRYGELYIQRHPLLKIKVVDGSSLAVAVVLNSIPKGTTQILLRGKVSKVAYSIAYALCQRGIKVATLCDKEYEKLNKRLGTKSNNNLVLSTSYSHKIWLVGEGLTEEEQSKASKETVFIPFSQIPPKKMRKDCFYHNTPAMITPEALKNIHTCENWLPRRVMSVWRIAGIVHALEGWDIHECGSFIFNIDKIWEATLRHGFLPLIKPT